MDMNSRGYIAFLPELVKEGRVSEQRLDEAVENVLGIKMLLGLFDNPFDRITWDEIDLDAHRAAARKPPANRPCFLKTTAKPPPL